MRRSRCYLGAVALLLALAAVLTGRGRLAAAAHIERQLPEQRRLVAALQLTDLALWSEARYTRHPAMTDLFSPFQDHPGAMEHFPAGALFAPRWHTPETAIGIRRRDAEAR
ncbi:MAG: hypothetical protein FDZ69_10810 [Deltaproteobacteria bacterium]|nr:MAG: hypothetical protein FDZ69_10810 [Deltaproteobacteria bacterium]